MSAFMNDVLLPARGPRLLAKDRIVAGPGSNRWLVAPSVLAIRLHSGNGLRLLGFLF